VTIRHGKAFWPGMASMISCTYTASHGITPGAAVLVCAPQADTLAVSGDLVITDDVVTVTLPRCRLDKLDVQRDGSGFRWTLLILDRRWSWKDCNLISGVYNQPDPHGILYPWSVKRPSELARLCLEAMGETNFMIDVPDVALPPVNWDAANPAQALSSLAESLGCRVIYRALTDDVLVCPLGKGAGLPDGSINSEGPSLDSAERPDSLKLVGAPVRFQARFRMQAVGKDWDGLYRPLDALSYAPSEHVGGWKGVGPPTFSGLQATTRLTRLQAIDLAQQSVYKCYQLVNLTTDVGNGPLQVPGYPGPIVRREQILLEDTKVEQVQPTEVDNALINGRLPGRPGEAPVVVHFYDGFSRDVPAECYGSYYFGRLFDAVRNPNGNLNGDGRKKITVPFSVDTVFQVITFSDYVYRAIPNDGTNPIVTSTPVAAAVDVILETGCQIRDAFTNQVARYELERPFAPPYSGTGPAVVRHDDVQFNVIGQYNVQSLDADNTEIIHIPAGVRAQSGLGFGLAETITRANYYLDREADKYQLKGGLTRNYNGLMAVALDGTVQQVTWSVGEPGWARTTASLNTEHSTYIPDFGKRLAAEYAPNPKRRDGRPDTLRGIWGVLP
jgi:hypothetical protein